MKCDIDARAVTAKRRRTVEVAEDSDFETEIQKEGDPPPSQRAKRQKKDEMDAEPVRGTINAGNEDHQNGHTKVQVISMVVSTAHVSSYNQNDDSSENQKTFVKQRIGQIYEPIQEFLVGNMPTAVQPEFPATARETQHSVTPEDDDLDF